MSSPSLRATATLIGTIIGAGIFGIPYVTAQSGYLVGLAWLVGLTILTIAISLAYAHVIMKDNPHRHQLAGYGQHYFSQPGKWFATFILMVGQWGALVAYIIGVGEFLATLIGKPELTFPASVLTFIVGAIIILLGLKVVASVEGVISFLMIGMVILLGLIGINKIDTNNLSANFNTSTQLANLFLPYGIIFGALSGAAVLPEVYQILKDARKQTLFPKVIIIGVLIPAIIYAVFQFTVVGISGANTSEEAVAGLVSFFNPSIVKAGALFGILAMGTSFLTLAYALKDMFDLDFGLQPVTAWFLAMFPPFFVFLLGLRNFITAFEFTGAWIGTLTTIFIFSLYWKSNQ